MGPDGTARRLLSAWRRARNRSLATGGQPVFLVVDDLPGMLPPLSRTNAATAKQLQLGGDTGRKEDGDNDQNEDAAERRQPHGDDNGDTEEDALSQTGQAYLENDGVSDLLKATFKRQLANSNPKNDSRPKTETSKLRAQHVSFFFCRMALECGPNRYNRYSCCPLFNGLSL